MRRETAPIAGAALLLGLALAALAGLFQFAESYAADGEGAYTLNNGQSETYFADQQTAPFNTGYDGTDTLASVATIGTKVFALRDAASGSLGVRQNLSCSLRFSDSGATATVWVAFYNYDRDSTTYHLKEVDTFTFDGTIDATSAQDASGKYLSKRVVVDSGGSSHAQIFVTNVTAGTVDAWLGSF